MKHRRIQKSNRYRKIKTVNSPKEFNYINDAVIEKESEQFLSRKLLDIIEFKKTKLISKSKNEVKKKSSRNRNKICVRPSEPFQLESGMTRVPKSLPESITKESHESNHHFMNKLNRMVAQSIAEANLESHFEIDLGDRVPEKKESKKNSNSKRSIESDDDSEKIARKRQKNQLNSLRRKARKLKKQRRLVRKLQNMDEQKDSKFSMYKKSSDWNEVADCPPVFNFRKK
ncbi:secreted frizzled-related protein 1-like [Sarcoptes scabiei]|nr:secreted frizzled-related protein 1-like [Sarcoptes scabiei]